VKVLRYIELKSGYSDNGLAWIGYATQSKTGRTLYFNGRGLVKLKGQRRGESGGNYIDMETGESFWVSGIKKNGEDRHWAGSGKTSLRLRRLLNISILSGPRNWIHQVAK
jgi:hypothetical protein